MFLHAGLLSVCVLASSDGVTYRYVDDDAPPGGDGHSWRTAHRYLQDALVDLQPFTNIRVAGGEYRPDRSTIDPDGTGDRFATFDLTSGVTYLGGYAGLTSDTPYDRDPERYPSILTGDLLGDDGPEFANNEENSHHVVTTSDADASAIIDGFTITAGHANGPLGPNLDGAGINNLGGSPSISNCIFIHNVANTDTFPHYSSSGGGIYIYGGSPRIAGCTFDSNIGGAAGGGGIYTAYGNPIIIDCVFVNNFAGVNFGGAALSSFTSNTIVVGCIFRDNSTFPGGGHGAAVSNWGLSLPMYRDCLFERNHSGGSAGAMSGIALVERCTFVDNKAEGYGGAIGGAYPFAIVRDCVFRNNRAGRHGGALHFNHRGGTFINCWFQGNIAGGEGGALSLSSTKSGSRAVNCVLIDNHAGIGGAVFTRGGHTSLFSNCLLADNVATVAGGAIAGYVASTANSIIRGNTPDQVDPDADVRISFCNIEGGWVGAGAGNIDADPLFVDRPQFDFRLQADSPCIDAGWTLGVPLDVADVDNDGDALELMPLDLDDRPRFVDAKRTDTGCGSRAHVDLGPFEYALGQSAQPKYGDLDSDGLIGLSDLLILLDVFGESDSCEADFDGDGHVGFLDMITLLGLWRAA